MVAVSSILQRPPRTFLRASKGRAPALVLSQNRHGARSAHAVRLLSQRGQVLTWIPSPHHSVDSAVMMMQAKGGNNYCDAEGPARFCRPENQNSGRGKWMK